MQFIEIFILRHSSDLEICSSSRSSSYVILLIWKYATHRDLHLTSFFWSGNMQLTEVSILEILIRVFPDAEEWHNMEKGLDELHISRCRRKSVDGDLNELRISRSEEWRKMKSRWVAYFEIRRMTRDGDLDELHISSSEECQKMDISTILDYDDSRISRCRRMAH